MFIVYKHQTLGTYHTVEVATIEEAAKYEPYIPFASANEGHALSNHLNGHPTYSRNSCTVCRPNLTPRPTDMPPQETEGQRMSKAIAAAESRLKARMKP